MVIAHHRHLTPILARKHRYDQTRRLDYDAASEPEPRIFFNSCSSCSSWSILSSSREIRSGGRARPRATRRQPSSDKKPLLLALDQLVSELIAKTGRDSQNSSKPPSSDGPGTRADRRREERERRKAEPAGGPAPGKKKRGGQHGHPGNGLAFSRTPDAKVVLEPGACRGCGGDLAGGVQAAAEALQVVDIPGVRALVTEYLLISRRCGCGTVTRAHAPQGAAVPLGVLTG